ncbi:ATP-dependent DNA helicase PIF1 [Metarhizium guizhouense ARSEF 977]|uniref:ATP-dependent DNA helicase PIF1 n=1 Tax=Metarhizium guizhouense (strain ARSEF 977) TaxID=1276136 RepID=A0A0B4GG59_METGA|nr:ATP-dependent DNA helicase PIF1 [Metarhizium guizhouense ARSEF 977]
MDSKYCSSCLQKHVLSSFLKDTSSDLGSKIFSTCIPCRTKNSKKRKALQPACPDVPPKRRGRPKLSVLPTSRPTRPLLIPRPLESALPPLRESPTRPSPSAAQPRNPQVVPPGQHTAHSHAAGGFLPTEQWGYIQSFNAAMDQIKMETCARCKERWFAMDLKDGVCHACFLRDKGNKTPFLMSAENEMDPGELPTHLPELTQVEEMIIARCHIQMVVYRYRGHQYHYSGHCVSFMQNIAKTVNTLPNLPSELDIVVLRPSNQVMENDQRYQRQFRSSFRVRKGRIVAWLQYLKVNHPDYQRVTISLNRLDTLPVDDDVSLSFVSIINNPSNAEGQAQPVSTDNAPTTSQSMVPNLNITATEVDLILREISGLGQIPPHVPAPEVRSTPIDEAAGSERIFAMAFPTLYPTGRADFNTPRIRQVSSLPRYLRHG